MDIFEKNAFSKEEIKQMRDEVKQGLRRSAKQPDIKELEYYESLKDPITGEYRKPHKNIESEVL